MDSPQESPIAAQLGPGIPCHGAGCGCFNGDGAPLLTTGPISARQRELEGWPCMTWPARSDHRRLCSFVVSDNETLPDTTPKRAAVRSRLLVLDPEVGWDGVYPPRFAHEPSVFDLTVGAKCLALVVSRQLPKGLPFQLQTSRELFARGRTLHEENAHTLPTA
jgi:hypothetical protein